MRLNVNCNYCLPYASLVITVFRVVVGKRNVHVIGEKGPIAIRMAK